MRFVQYTLTFFCFILIGCDNNQSTTEVVDTENTTKEVKITAKAIEDFDYTDYALSPESEIALADWEKYQELSIQMNYLKKADLSFFTDDKETLKEFIEELKIATPDEIRTNPIMSRIVILETSLLKLNENLTIENIEGRIKLLSIKDLFIAFSNLNYQINKKLESDLYNKIQPEY